MSILNNNYKPWSVLWILQRTVMVMKERRLFKIEWKTLFYDFHSNREVKEKLKSFPSQALVTSGTKTTQFLDFQPQYQLNPLITCEYISDIDLSVLNQYFDKIYVVNLEKRIDRRIEMIQKLNRLKIRAEFFKAVDGYTPANVGEYKSYLERPIDESTAHELEKKYKRKVIYSPGAWGTLKTYKKLFSDAISHKYERILCLQDDVVFHKSFETEIKKLIWNIPENWKLLYLGATQHSWNPGVDFKATENNPLNSKSFSLYHPINTDGAFAVGIHHSVFKLILKEIHKMNCSFDSGALRSIMKKYREDCFVFKPNLIIADVKDSDIRVARNQEDFSKVTGWDLSLYDYPFKKDLVSIVMPAYNAGKTIAQSIKSILTQDYRDLELIVVDDCSTDDTEKIVRNLMKHDERIKYYKQNENKGCYASRNSGIRLAKGDYIGFQDADDISLKHRIEFQLVPLILGKAEFTMSRIVRTDNNLNDFNLDNQEEILTDPDSVFYINKNELREKNKVGYITVIMKRKLFEELGLFWENRFGADAEYIERILYNKANYSLPKQYYAQYFLSRVKSLDSIYSRIDKITALCYVQGEQNLTNKHKAKERLAFQDKWRARLRNEFEYEYPKL